MSDINDTSMSSTTGGINSSTTSNPVASTPATATAPTTSTEPTAVPTTSTQPETSTLPATTMDSSKPEPIATETPVSQAPVTETKPESISPVGGETAPAAALDDKKDDVTGTTDKIAEPITHGQLGYKGPGLLKYV